MESADEAEGDGEATGDEAALLLSWRVHTIAVVVHLCQQVAVSKGIDHPCSALADEEEGDGEATGDAPTLLRAPHADGGAGALEGPSPALQRLQPCPQAAQREPAAATGAGATHEHVP